MEREDTIGHRATYMTLQWHASPPVHSPRLLAFASSTTRVNDAVQLQARSETHEPNMQWEIWWSTIGGTRDWQSNQSRAVVRRGLDTPADNDDGRETVAPAKQPAGVVVIAGVRARKGTACTGREGGKPKSAVTW